MEKEWNKIVKEIAQKAKKEGLGILVCVEQQEGINAITGKVEKISASGIKLYGSYIIPYEDIVSIGYKGILYRKNELWSSF
jgi:triosephosphate isomerase